ncbi:8687_t:CDS:2 [Paraglomus brasilianum]|uniref:8687_t:CDS:1 n=1 Tax=Paraglomus brasilianum TaxID=144538 RepID=A0A9N9BAZ9_9GLOM|nr:8687_t:CDS:2 [Paraglomus brasilianum]
MLPLLTLLRLYYLTLISTSFISAIIPTLRASFLKYGKTYSAEAATALGRVTVHKSLFWHFYVIGFIWVFFLLVDILYLRFSFIPWLVHIWCDESDYGAYYRQDAEVCLIGLMMLFIQVSRRGYECFFVEKPSKDARMHIGHYLVGITFYLVTGLAVCIEGFGNLGVFDINASPLVFPLINSLVKPKIVFSAVLFLIASYHQHKLHKILASLRGPNSPKYSVTKGDWYDHISSAHYFAEILIYLSFVVLNSGGNITLWLAFLWTIVGLGVTARENEQWGKEKFKEDWPRNRYIIIPWIY